MLQERRAAMPPLSNAARALRAQSGTDRVTELPEVAPAVLPGHLKFLDGRPKQPEAVSARDFFKTQELHEKMKSLALSDHFDSFGKDAEVKQRQVAILFAELPRFLEYLPSSVPLASMEPELGRQEDPQARAAALRGNALLRQPASQRRFRQAEVLAVVQVLKAWSLASWPNGGAELGMDRSTFCRFLLDTGLADQRKVPFFWAVSLFDSSARLVRYCAEEEAAVGTAPLLPVVNWKDLWQILEALVQQYFRPSSSAMRLKFIESIAEISRARLPSFAVKMMNISKEHLNLMIQGVGTEDRDSDAEECAPDERAKAPRSLRVPSAKARQLSILEEARKQRLRSLLVEPEVLQLLWQHEDVFKELHSAYADERGHLSFAAVVQLCKDFSLAPRLISLHLLRKIYESSECLELDLEADESRNDSPGLDALAKPRKSSPVNAKRRRSISAMSGISMASTAATTATPTSGRRSSDAFSAKQKRATVLSDKRTSQRRASFEGPEPSAQERAGLILPWEGILLRLREAQSRGDMPCNSHVRSQALMEILCKVAYTYLGCYGNMQQRSMSTLLQSVWLLVYLRFTVESFRRSLAQREEVEEEAPLLQAVRRLDPDAWVIDDAPDFEDGMPVQSAKVLPREAGRQKQEALKEGTPYVVNDTCQVCKSRASPCDWGSLRCFACSKLDSLAFKRHPLIALLRRALVERSAAMAGKPPRVRSTPLSPPPFQENDKLQPGGEE
ncbi:unnamed protein product, partial [Effrenium voratum]